MTFKHGDKVRYKGTAKTSELVGREGEVVPYPIPMLGYLTGTVGVSFPGLTETYIVLASQLEKIEP